ncbi:MAG: methylene-tetrahydromethanopterin dehydrogenase N-terminal domain-containing protein [Promethearchaeota archaeon]
MSFIYGRYRRTTSPFDINMAYESGYDMCVYFKGINTEDIMRFMYDLYYSRDKANRKYSTVFLNGKDFDKVYSTFDKAKIAMNNKINFSIIIGYFSSVKKG